MITRLRVRNFKRFSEIDIELGKAVVLIGPNNSGKTSALQALALWDLGLRRWNEKYRGKTSPEHRPGVTINRRDIFSVPVPDANFLWRNLHVRERKAGDSNEAQGQRTGNVRIEIIVDGVAAGRLWSCGLEFDYANPESLYCRPLRLDDEGIDRMPVPYQASLTGVAFLPPMSGLADREFVKQAGEIGVLVGQGQTAQVLRNLCLWLFMEPKSNHWDTIRGHIQELFGITLLNPEYIAERSEITLAYRDETDNELDLSASGRGLQQTLLLLAHLYRNPKSLLLLDEPDAHLEVLRQRQTYNLLTAVAAEQGSQIVAASHSEVVLSEAAGKDTVVAFVGKPHRINDRGSQLIKSLCEIGFDQYHQALQTGWVLYVENATDLAILQQFAETLGHKAAQYLKRPFVKYIGTNQPQHARDHFHGLREAKHDLVGVALFDHLEKELHENEALVEMMWSRREIENYFCNEEVLIAYTTLGDAEDLFEAAENIRRKEAMVESIKEIDIAMRTLRNTDMWSYDVKASDEVLDPLFRNYFKKLGLPLIFRKADYHILASLIPPGMLDPEIVEKLDIIVAVAERAVAEGQ